MTTLRVLTVSLVLCVSLGLSAVSTAGSPGPNKKHSAEKSARKADQWRFQDHEIRIILGYFKDTEGLPPGLAKKDTLPPGLAKQVRERGTLPPGLQKRIQPLPADLVVKLPKLPESLIRVVIGVDVVLMDSVDNLIFDVLENVFVPR